jgi:hypothetical protein
VDAAYAGRLSAHEAAPFQQLEERMARFRRDTEARCKADTAAAVSRVRELEVRATPTGEREAEREHRCEASARG